MTRTRPRPISINLKLSHEVALFSTPFIKLHDNLCSLEYVVKTNYHGYSPQHFHHSFPKMMMMTLYLADLQLVPMEMTKREKTYR